MQILFFNPDEPIEDPKSTTLMGFFKLCEQDDFAKTLLYVEVPNHYTWKKVEKEMKWVKREKKEALGRVYTGKELHCLRLLLFTVKGPTSFHSIRTFEGRICSTFKGQ